MDGTAMARPARVARSCGSRLDHTLAQVFGAFAVHVAVQKPRHAARSHLVESRDRLLIAQMTGPISSARPERAASAVGKAGAA